MPLRSHRRSVLLFLAAILVPCLVLVMLSLRMISQERELAEKRLAEEQRRLTGQIRQELLARLERIKLQEAGALAAQAGVGAGLKPAPPPARPQNAAVVFLGWVENNRLALPWEVSRTSAEFRQLLGGAEFAKKIQQGEHEELVTRQLGKAAGFYRESAAGARHPAQSAYARLLLARVLAKAGRHSEALALYQKILPLPSEVVDEHGVPLALYAAGRLLEAGVAHQHVLERISAGIDEQRWLPPAECYMLRGLGDTLVEKAPDAAIREAARDVQRKISTHLRRLEQALALEHDFPNLRLTQAGGNLAENSEPIWLPYGEELWLVSVAPPLAPYGYAGPSGTGSNAGSASGTGLAGTRPAVVVVRAKEAFASLDQANLFSGGVQWSGLRFLAGSESKGEKGELLGQNFPGLRVAFTTRDDGAFARQWELQRYFYLVALLLVLSVTLSGGYFVWRDVRRELRLAEMRSQFVSSVSHELKTPLTAIRMFADTLRMGHCTDPQMQAEYMETISNESERLTRLLNNVLDFSKIERGQKTYRPEPTSLADVVHAAARAMQYPLAQQGFELRVDVRDGLATVRVDPDALQQAILNLLTNAMKYSGQSREIDLRLGTENGRAVIQVTDRGIGIDPREQARVFEKFYRVATRENQLIPGTGLGLALVEHIVKAHGGRVEVHSAPGQGSTFSIHLPLETKA